MQHRPAARLTQSFTPRARYSVTFALPPRLRLFHRPPALTPGAKGQSSLKWPRESRLRQAVVHVEALFKPTPEPCRALFPKAPPPGAAGSPCRVGVASRLPRGGPSRHAAVSQRSHQLPEGDAIGQRPVDELGVVHADVCGPVRLPRPAPDVGRSFPAPASRRLPRCASGMGDALRARGRGPAGLYPYRGAARGRGRSAGRSVHGQRRVGVVHIGRRAVQVRHAHHVLVDPAPDRPRRVHRDQPEPASVHRLPAAWPACPAHSLSIIPLMNHREAARRFRRATGSHHARPAQPDFVRRVVRPFPFPHRTLPPAPNSVPEKSDRLRARRLACASARCSTCAASSPASSASPPPSPSPPRRRSTTRSASTRTPAEPAEPSSEPPRPRPAQGTCSALTPSARP